jgi:hypothetical protein
VEVFTLAARDPSVGSIICVFDALDECQYRDRKILIRSLKHLYTSASINPNRASTLKFVVTSRPYNDIELSFYSLTDRFPIIRLAGEEESDKISYEIGVVINAKVEEIAKKRKLRENARSALQKRLHETPNRTNLWLHLTLDQVEIGLGSAEKKLRKIVNTLPKSIEEAYEKILAKCQQQDEAKRVLHIIVAALRPLTLNEIDVALEIKPDSKSYNDLDLEGDEKRKAWIRAACGIFVNVVDSRIFLIHQTAREFLVRKNTDAG